MKLTIVIRDGDDVTEVTRELEQYRGIPPMLRLMATVLQYTLARTYYLCVAVGLDVLVKEYAACELKARQAELRQIVGP